MPDVPGASAHEFAHTSDDEVCEMGRIKVVISAAVLMLLFAVNAHAQFKAFPDPLPPEPKWGEYDDSHTWRDAKWWWENRADWVRAHHPEWWGDFDDHHVWHPAGWWWQTKPDWCRSNHPEWWGDFDEHHVWLPAAWWAQNRPEWVKTNHPEWWGDFDDHHVWHDDAW
jgi:hypothetical protein